MTELNYDLFGNVAPEPPPTVKLSTPVRRHRKNPNQMYLFATGKEIMEHVTDSVDNPPDRQRRENREQMWYRKLRESHDRGYLPLFARSGIDTPVTILPYGKGIAFEDNDTTEPGFTMGQGHHRVATANALSQRGHEVYVPVVYDNDFNYSDMPSYLEDYPYGPRGALHEFAKNNPPGKWAGVDPIQQAKLGDLTKPRDED